MSEASVEVLRHSFQEAKDLIQVQSESLGHLRHNASALLGFDGVIFGLAVAGFTFIRSEGTRIIDFPLGTALLAIGTLAILASTLFAAWCLRPKQLVGGLPSHRLVEVIDYDVAEPEFLAQAIRAYDRFVARNSYEVEATAKLQGRAALALVLGILMYMAGAGVLLYQGV